MKKSYIAILAVVLVVAGYLLVKNILSEKTSSSTIALSSSSEIDKIIISPTTGSEITLNKDATWKINSKFEANIQSVDFLLQALSGIQISGISTENTTSNGTVVQLFAKGKLIKKYNILDYSDDKKATLIQVDNSEKQVYVAVPGMISNLHKRIVTDPLYWRTKKIISLRANEIKSVSVSYQQARKTYKIQNENQINLQNINGEKIEINQEKANQYLGYFSNISFEKAITTLTKKQKDSLLRQPPVFTLEVVDNKGVSNTIKGYPRPDENEDENIDMNKFTALINNDSEVVIMKYYDLDLILKSVEYFEKK